MTAIRTPFFGTNFDLMTLEVTTTLSGAVGARILLKGLDVSALSALFTMCVARHYLESRPMLTTKQAMRNFSWLSCATLIQLTANFCFSVEPEHFSDNKHFSLKVLSFVNCLGLILLAAMEDCRLLNERREGLLNR